jgi:hypothetical protein
VLLIGLGDPAEGDAGAGALLADALTERFGSRVTTRTGAFFAPEWAELFGEQDAVVLMTGEIDLEAAAIEPLQPAAQPGSTVGGLLRQLADSTGRAPRTYLVRIPTSDSPTLTDVTRDRLAELDATLTEMLERFVGPAER